MNRNEILEAMYKVIRDPVRVDIKDASYSSYVNGVVDIVSEIFREEELKTLDDKVVKAAIKYSELDGKIDACVTTAKLPDPPKPVTINC